MGKALETLVVCSQAYPLVSPSMQSLQPLAHPLEDTFLLALGFGMLQQIRGSTQMPLLS